VSEYRLTPRTAFGAEAPHVVSHGAARLEERPGVALASVAARAGQADAVAAALTALTGGEAGIGGFYDGTPIALFWSGPSQWFAMADRGGDDMLADTLKAHLGDAASITDQSDGWVAFDLTGARLEAVLERLCNVDLAGFGAGGAVRTVIGHMPAFVLCRSPGAACRLLCMRSMATGFAHAVGTAMASVAAQAGH
jgi:sarcosine oxidase subunit gamma